MVLKSLYANLMETIAQETMHGRADLSATRVQRLRLGPAWRWRQALEHRTAASCPAEVVDPLARQATEFLHRNCMRSLNSAEPRACNSPAIEIVRDHSAVALPCSELIRLPSSVSRPLALFSYERIEQLLA